MRMPLLSLANLGSSLRLPMVLLGEEWACKFLAHLQGREARFSTVQGLRRLVSLVPDRIIVPARPDSPPLCTESLCRR